MEGFREISPYEIDYAAKRIGKDWMLITVRDEEKGSVNAMTASWGSLGVLWNKCVCTCFVRPQRHTFGLLESEESFTVAFLDEEYRDALRLCGRVSGKDRDKLAEAGLTVADAQGVPAVAEAQMILVCRKLYADDLKEEGFLDDSLLAHYEAKDFHRMYVCEIQRAYVREA